MKNEPEDARHHHDGKTGGNGNGISSAHLQSGFMANDLTTDEHRWTQIFNFSSSKIDAAGIPSHTAPHGKKGRCELFL